MTYVRSVQGYLFAEASLLLMALAGIGCGATETNVSEGESAVETNVSEGESAVETNVSRGDCADAQPCESDENDEQQSCADDSECDQGARCSSKGACIPNKARSNSTPR